MSYTPTDTGGTLTSSAGSTSSTMASLAVTYPVMCNARHWPPSEGARIIGPSSILKVAGMARGALSEQVSGTADHGQAISEGRARNPTWVRDELILALDFYLHHEGKPPSQNSAEIAELSETLNRLGRYLGIATTDRFRNVNGVYMKMANFRRLDPKFTQAGRIGLRHGGREEEAVWNDFAADPQYCHDVAEAIRQALADAREGETIADGPAEPGITEAEEGRVMTRRHLSRERNSTLVKARKQVALAKFGRLVCEACGFDFGVRYGERGEGFIECHHAKPVHTIKSGEKTKLTDLRLLCANCHRMVHAKRHWLTIEELVATLRTG